MQITQSQPVASPMLPVDLNVMKEISQPTLSAMKAFNGALAKNCSSYQNEVMRFVNSRLHENASIPARLAACKTPLEVQGVCGEYWARAFNQYSEEFQRLAKLCQVGAPQGRA